MAAASAYVLRWGSHTWMAALLMGVTLGTSILCMEWWVGGDNFHSDYYVPILGYYVAWSIAQSHYFRCPPVPNRRGFLRQAISLGGAIGTFFLHDVIISDVFGVPSELVLPGHFCFIILGFFFYGWDDFYFKGALSRWIPRDSLKALFWYAFLWVLWTPLFPLEGGLSSARSGVNGWHDVAFNWFLGWFQWVVMCSLLVAITWKDYLASLSFRNDYVRGIILLALSVLCGFIISFVCFHIVHAADPDLPDANAWHHVLYTGTFPLMPIIIFGLYSHGFNNVIKHPTQRVIARTGFIFSLVVLWYILFRFAVAPTGIFGSHPWHHHFDLVFNFTCSILPLTHHWFNGKWLFVKKAETPFVSRKYKIPRHRGYVVSFEMPQA